MNLEKLIKLVKLANNNPNEHEANLAARKVCKMIAEGNYKFNEPVAKMDTPPGVRPNPTPGDIFDELFRKTYGQRNNNPGPRPEDYYQPSQASNQWGGYGGFSPFGGAGVPPNYTPPKKSTEGYPINEYDPITGKRKEKPKRTLKCKECSEYRETSFQGLDSLFVCNPCIWEGYTKEKKK